MKLSSLLAGGIFALNTAALPQQTAKCAPKNGTFTVEAYQLYPENADWDTKKCLLYFGYDLHAS